MRSPSPPPAVSYNHIVLMGRTLPKMRVFAGLSVPAAEVFGCQFFISHRLMKARSNLRRLSAVLAVAAIIPTGCAQRQEVRTIAETTTVAAAPQPPAAPPAPVVEPPPARPANPPAKEVNQLTLPEYQRVFPLPGDNWTLLFDGETLKGWERTKFAGGGDVEVERGELRIGMGAMLSGVNLLATNGIPRYGYELALDAMKLDGSDFFCGLTFVVGDSCCSLIIGGWGGGLVGISSIDGNDASMNETTKFMEFPARQWFRVRVRVTRTKLEAWIGEAQVANVTIEGRRLTVRPGEIELSQPFGIATYQTSAAFRNIQWRPVP